MASILLTATKDTAVYQGSPDTEYGTTPLVTCGCWDTGEIKRFIAGGFPISAIPDRAVIKSATLRIYRNQFFPSTNYNGDPVNELQFYIWAVTGSWSEATTNWNNRPSITTANQVIWNVSPADPGGAVMITKDITTLFNHMCVSGYDSIQMLISPEARGETYMYIYCREAGASGGLSRVTEIYVEYELPIKIAASQGSISKAAQSIKINTVQGNNFKNVYGMKIAPAQGSINKVVF